MPPEIRAEAAEVECFYRDWPHAAGDDRLGEYHNFNPYGPTRTKGPIILYLGSIKSYCDDYYCDFAEEVRQTYLHELGHHPGLEEEDLRERGL